jgi:hypothetical protein
VKEFWMKKMNEWLWRSVAALAVVAVAGCASTPAGSGSGTPSRPDMTAKGGSNDPTPVLQQPVGRPVLASYVEHFRVRGPLKLNVATDSPIHATFERSPSLTTWLREALTRQGYAVAERPEDAKAVLRMSGELTLTGGPVFSRVGPKIDVATMAEQAASAVPTTTPSGVPPNAVMSIGIYAAGFARTGSSLLGAAMSGEIIRATGFSDWLNQKTFRDPRGVCMMGCDNWFKTRQNVYVDARLQRGGADAGTLRTRSGVFEETLAPEVVVAAGLANALKELGLSDPALEQSLPQR